MSTATPVASAPPATVPAAAPPNIAPAAGSQPSPAPGSVAAAACENCGAALSGRYCAACGQRVQPPVHSLWHFMRVAAEDLTHADSRLWRTLAALLFRPGYLTREFLAGRRARYLPPVRLYLVLSVMFFVCAAATQPRFAVLKIDTDAGPPTNSALVDPAEDKDIAAAGLMPRPGESREQHAQRVCRQSRQGTYHGPWQERLEPALRNACVRIMEDNGRSLQEAFLHNLPRAMFLFLPLLAGAMMLMYWRPRRYYVEHLLLFVHNHASVFLIVMLAWAVDTLLPFASSWVNGAVFFYIFWYLYRSMRVAYGQGRALTLLKLVLLSCFYFVCSTALLALTTLYAALTL